MRTPLLLSRTLLPALALLAPFSSAVAQAQQTPDPTQHTSDLTQTLPEVHVDGKRPRPPASRLAMGDAVGRMDTPFSVSQVTAPLLREQAAVTLQDALRNVPGAQADSGFNGSHTQFFSLRGAVADSGTGSNRVVRDGVRLSNYPFVPAFVSAVNVLRGPGAAVGVRAEPGGTVEIATVQPELHNAGAVLWQAGSAQARESSVDLNRVISYERGLAARITATRSRSSEWRHVEDGLNGVKLGLASLGGPLQWRAGFESTDQRYQPDYGLPALDGRMVAVPRDRQLGEPFGDSTTRNRLVDLHGQWQVEPGQRISFDATHLEARATAIKNLLNGSPLPGQPRGTWARVTSWEPGSTRRIDSFTAAWSAQRMWGDVVHHWHASWDWYREALNQPALSAPASTSPPINVFDPVMDRVTLPGNPAAWTRSNTVQDLRATGLSVQDQMDLGDWSLVAGARLDRQHFVYGAAGVLPVQEHHVSPKAAVLRHLGPAQTVYANVSTGLSPNQVASSSNQSLASRQSTQYEAGWRSTWRNGDLETDAAVFRLDQRNMISSDLSTPSNFDFTLAGRARSQGLEMAVNGRPLSRVLVTATYAYTDALYVANAVYGGHRVPNVARHTASLYGSLAWGEGWASGLGVSAQSRRFADEANVTVLPGYARVDFIQGWKAAVGEGESLSLQLAVRNLFDKNYQVSSHLHTSRWITPAQGRNLSLTAALTF